MADDYYLRTIPHTGTRFVMSILNYLGVGHQQWHFGWPDPPEYIQFDDKRVPLYVVPRVTGATKYIVTARNPYHTWESLEFNGGRRSDKRERSIRTTEQLSAWHGELEAWCDSSELVFVLSLDTTDQQQELTDLAQFCGVEYDGDFVWEIDSPSGCQHGDCPEDVKKQLHGAYQWYSHHTSEVVEHG